MFLSLSYCWLTKYHQPNMGGEKFENTLMQNEQLIIKIMLKY